MIFDTFSELYCFETFQFIYQITRAYGAIAPEPLGCASHSYLTEESVTDKRTNEHTSPIFNTDFHFQFQQIPS